MKLYLVISLVLIISCGDNSDGKKNKRIEAKLEGDSIVISDPMHDSDGDGILDKDDPEPFLADIPIVSGEFFNKMRVQLWSTGTNLAKVSEWEIDWNRIEVQGQGGSPKVHRPKPRSMMDYYLKSGARRFSWKMDQVPVEIDTDYLIDSFSSPVMTREEMINISKSLKGSDLNSTLSAIVDFQTDIVITSSKYKYFKDLTINAFYISADGYVREIENVYIDGYYDFNKVVQVNNKINLLERESVDALIVSGSRLFVKVIDFTIVETNEKYSDILRKVRTKSIPLLFSNGESRPERYFVGIKGEYGSIEDILVKAFGRQQIDVSNNRINSVRGLSNRLTRREDDWGNIFNQWVIGTTRYQSPFDNSFDVSDTILVGYYSNYEKDSFPTFMRSSDLTEKEFKTERSSVIFDKTFKIKDMSQKIEIVVNDLSFDVPVQKLTRETRFGVCGGREIWLEDRSENTIYEVDYEKKEISDFLLNTSIELSDEDGIFFSEAMGDKGANLLRSSKTLNSIVIDSPLLRSRSSSEIDVRVRIKLNSSSIQVGEVENLRRCIPHRTSPPHLGNEIREPEVFSVKDRGVKTHRFNPKVDGSVTILAY